MNLDHDWHIGVCGWKVGGRHVRLKDVLQSGGGEKQIQEHKNAMLLLFLVYTKLKDELDEIEAQETENEVHLQREEQPNW